MKKALIMITACVSLTAGSIYAQDTSALKDSTSRENRETPTGKVANDNENGGLLQPKVGTSKPTTTPKRKNDEGFRDDSTDAAVGMSGLSTTPGVSTTIGTGGLGTNETTGENTSSDIYNIERKDSIRRAKELKKEDHQNKSKTGPSN
ncbi:MAG TPA: hypothetical protein VFZ33_15320 [Chitinophagaceae bacterium]